MQKRRARVLERYNRSQEPTSTSCVTVNEYPINIPTSKKKDNVMAKFHSDPLVRVLMKKARNIASTQKSDRRCMDELDSERTHRIH
jgi:hypothetical protein